MKKLFVLGLLVAASSVSATSYAREGGAYIGIGGSYAINDFYTEKFEDRAVPIEVNIDDTWGANAKLGYHVNEFFAVEAVFDYLSGFETSEVLADPTMTGAASVRRIISEDGELDVMTFMLAGKFSWPGRAIEPYGLIGGGVMHANWDRKLGAGSASVSMRLRPLVLPTAGFRKGDQYACRQRRAGLTLALPFVYLDLYDLDHLSISCS